MDEGRLIFFACDKQTHYMSYLWQAGQQLILSIETTNQNVYTVPYVAFLNWGRPWIINVYNFFYDLCNNWMNFTAYLGTSLMHNISTQHLGTR